MAENSVNYSQHTANRIMKMKNLSIEQKAELLKEMTLSDDELKTHKAEHKDKKSVVSPDAAEYGEYYDEKISREQKTSEKNRLGAPVKEVISNKKEYLINMFFTLQKRHPDYQAEKATYTPEQLAMVNKMEKEAGYEKNSNGTGNLLKPKVKFVVDSNFLKAFKKVTGVDYRGAGVKGERCIVSKPEDLTSKSLLRHEVIHCAQQRDEGFYTWLAKTIIQSKRKQYTGPEKGTPSAVDYGTDNHLRDRETYLDQNNENALSKREKFEHLKYKNESALQKKYKEVREEELRTMKEQLEILEHKEQEGEKLTFKEMDKKKKLKQDILQFEEMLDRLENDKESRVVLIERDILPSKRDKNYDPEANLLTESRTNMKKRIKLEKTLYKDTNKILKAKEAELAKFEHETKLLKPVISFEAYLQKEKQIKEMKEEIKAYDDFLEKIEDDRDKSRTKSKQDRKAEIEERKRINGTS